MSGVRQDLPVSYRTLVLRTLVQALRAVFDHKTGNEYDYPEEQFRNLNAVTAYPLKRERWPAIQVIFNDGTIQNAGVGHEEEFADDSGVVRRWFHRYFQGSLEFTVCGITPYDREVLSDALLEILSFGRLNAVWSLFFDRIYGAPDDPSSVHTMLSQVNLNTDIIRGGGDNTTVAPWSPEDSLVHTRTYSLEVTGGFYNTPPSTPGLGYVTEVDVGEYITSIDGFDGETEPTPFIDPFGLDVNIAESFAGAPNPVLTFH